MEPDSYGARIARYIGVSIALHIVVFSLLVAVAPHLPQGGATNRLVALRRQVTELVAPPMQMTQKEANRGPLRQEFTVESIERHQTPDSLRAPGAAPKPALTGRKFKVPGAPVPAPRTVLPDLPQINVTQGQTQAPPPGLGVPAPPLAPAPAQEKPKLAFERPGANTGFTGQRGLIPKAGTSVDEAIRSGARQGGGLAVGDLDEGISSPVPGMRPSPNGGKLGSSLELLSDPQGADFRPYLTKVLSAVRRNWFAVIPESARLGRQGRVLVRFSITRDGAVQNFQISGPSGTEALDRAAVAGISASVPFPPLPSEFKGGWVRLQLTFLYNVQR